MGNFQGTVSRKQREEFSELSFCFFSSLDTGIEYREELFIFPGEIFCSFHHPISCDELMTSPCFFQFYY
jgi:hypothetical protein